MAEIKIQKKKPIWPWILLIVIIAVVAFLYFYGSMDTDEVDDMNNDEMEEVTHIAPSNFEYSVERIS